MKLAELLAMKSGILADTRVINAMLGVPTETTWSLPELARLRDLVRDERTKDRVRDLRFDMAMLAQHVK